MAGISDEFSTSAWRWMIDELEFVAGLVRQSKDAADKILRDALAEKAIGWHYIELVVEHANLPFALVAPEEIFWRRDPWGTTTIDVDYPNHRATRVGPPWRFREGPPITEKALGSDLDIEMPNILYNESPIFGGGPNVTVTASLIKLYHPDVERRCHDLDLLPPARPPVPVPTPAAVPEWDPQSEWSAERAMQELGVKGPATEKTLAAMPKLCSQLRFKGKTVPEILDSIKAPTMYAAIIRVTTKTSPETCEKILEAWQAWRAKPRARGG
jgi:hypothetical protein